jgi:exonuclease VII large subunit
MNRPVEPNSDPAARAIRALRDRLIEHLHRHLTARRQLQSDLDELDRAMMPRIAESYQRQIDHLTQRIEQLDSAIAAVEGRRYEATAAIELRRQTRHLQKEEREILAQIELLAERAQRGEDVTTRSTQYSWRLEHIRAQLALITAITVPAK